MPHVLVVGHMRREGLDLLAAVPGVTVEVLESPSPAEILAAMPQAEAVIVRTAPIARWKEARRSIAPARSSRSIAWIPERGA